MGCHAFPPNRMLSFYGELQQAESEGRLKKAHSLDKPKNAKRRAALRESDTPDREDFWAKNFKENVEDTAKR